MVTLQNLIEFDDTVLDGLECPEGLDVNALKSVVKMRLGLCYPTYDEPEVFKSMLTTWSFAHQWNMQHLIKANSVDYAPLENYDRYEDFTDRNTGGVTTNDSNTNTENRTDTNTNTANRTDTNTNTANRTFKTDSETTGTGTSETDTTNTNTNTVSAYNDSDFQNDNKSDGTGNSETNTTSSGEIDETKKETGTYTDRRDITGTITDARIISGTVTDSRVISVQNNGNINHAGRAHGNIGVTTTQQMFESEINLIRGYNIYYEICNWIERDLFLQIY